MFSNLNLNQKGLILVLVPLVFEVFFVVIFACMFNSALADLNKLEIEKEVLLRAGRHSSRTGRAMIASWQAITELVPGREEVIIAQLEQFEQILKANHVERLAGKRNEPKELTELIDEAESIGADTANLVEHAVHILRSTGVRKLNVKDKQIFWTMLFRLEEVTKKMNDASARIRSDEPEKLKQIRVMVTILLISGLVACCLISIGLAQLFNKDILARLNIIVNNAVLLSVGKPLPAPQTGFDEFAQLDRVLHQSAAVLSDARRKQLAVLDNAADVICSIDSKLRFVACGAASEKVWKVSSDELIGKNMLTIITADSVDKTREAFRGIAESGTLEGQLENIVRCSDGTFKNSHWTIRWSNDEKNYFCVVHDVTELRAVEKMKQNFLSMVSHDLRAPLNAVGISLAILLTEKRGPIPEETSKQLSKVELNMKRLMDLINELLELEKLESGKLAMEQQRVSALRVCGAAKEALETMASRAGVRIEIKGNDLAVLGEERRLVQVITNLLSNAIKFSPRDSTVRLDCTARAEFVQFKVSDEGPGIEADQRAFIFDKFRQARTVSNVAVKSSGLGLAIVKAIVEAHGGTVGVDSDLGKGSTFWFEIPLASEVASASGGEGDDA